VTNHVPRQVRRPTAADLDAAGDVVAAALRPTPVLSADGDGPALKLESAQPTGSFKVRGALAALARIDRDTPVVAASAGNHALGIAFAASRLGHRATVVTATSASPAKVDAIRRFGVELVQVGSSYDDAEAHALTLAAGGARYVSAYNDPDVIAGAATIGRELESQVDGPCTVIVPVGGGGLVAGLGLWGSGRADVRVVGVEATHNPVVSAAVRAGGVVDVELRDTIADGIAGGIEPGSVTVPIVADTVDELVSVSEDEIRAAIRYLALARGVVAEGAGAAATGAVLAGKIDLRGTPIAIVSGRNIAAELLAGVLVER
jgi:threonine dehydratase